MAGSLQLLFQTAMLTPLKDIELICCDCGYKANGESINRNERFHKYLTGKIVSLPPQGLDEEQVTQLKTMNFRCECCQEEVDEN